MKRLLDWIMYWQGRLRLRHGWCPSCNSSPPSLDCCICFGDRDYGPRISEFTRARWAYRWEKACRG